MIRKSILALACALLFSVGAFAQGYHYSNVVQDSTGRAIAGATITVCTSAATINADGTCTPTTPIYSDAALTTTESDPFSSDALGNYDFWVAPGSYIITITGTGITSRKETLTIPCVPSSTCSGLATGTPTTVGNTTLASNASAARTTTFPDASGIVAYEGQASDGIIFVSPNGSDSNDGLSWGTAKLTISGAVTGCPASGSCTVKVSPEGLTIATAFTVSRAQTTIECEPGATLTTTVASGYVITDSASDFRLTGCRFTWSSGTVNVFIAGNTLSRVSVDHDVFSGYGASSAGIITLGDGTNTSSATAVTDASIADNKFLSTIQDAVNIQDDVFRSTITGNQINMTPGANSKPQINAQVSDSNASMTGLVIANNMIDNGGTSFCVQVQVLSGLTNASLTNVTVTGNVCRATEAGAMGYSLIQIDGMTESGNLFDANGNSACTSEACFETEASHGSQTGNVAKLGSQSGNAKPFNYLAAWGNRSDLTISGNTATVAFTGTAASFCYYIGTTSAYSLTGVDFVGNTCDMTGSTSTGTLVGIHVQANNASAVVNDGSIIGNTLIGVTGTTYAIRLEDNLGTMTGWVVRDNNAIGWTHFTYSGDVADWGTAAGTVTLSAGAGSYNFKVIYSSAPICTATDTTAANAVKITSTATGITLAGTTTDVIAWTCSPAAN